MGDLAGVTTGRHAELKRSIPLELHRVVTVEIEDAKQCHPGPENGCRPLHKGYHSNAGRREVHGEQDVLDRRHGSPRTLA